MSTKIYNSDIVSDFPEGYEMVLPEEYRIDTTYDEDGNKVYHLRGGFYINDEGTEDFSFTGSFITLNVNVTGEGDPETLRRLQDPSDPDFAFNQVSEGVLNNLTEQFGPGKILKLYNSFPSASIMRFYKPLLFFGVPLESYILFFLVEVNGNTLYGFNTVYQKDSPSADGFYKHLLNVIEAVRVNGKPVNTGKLTPEKLEKALDLDDDEDVEALDLGLSFGLNIDLGDEELKYTFNNDGSIISERSDTIIKYAIPDESLYPHYKSKLELGGLGNLGFKVITNTAGTDYKFYSLPEIEDNASEELKYAISQLDDTNASAYSQIANRAKSMRDLFHVLPESFNPSEDRECELAEELMKSAYMMSLLRSFGWTVLHYCKDNEIGTAEIGEEAVYRIIDELAETEWINYDDKTVCKGLCGCQDLHVFYLPDSTTDIIKQAFLPSEETIAETKRIKESLPTYNPILNQVASLDELRNDLDLVGEAVEYIYDKLKRERDYSKPLTGFDADILYAWCALAYAARGPFFTEDGPMNCYFTQLDTEVPRDKGDETPFIGEKDGTVEYEDGKYVASGTTLIGYRDDTEVMDIPEGITDICRDICDENWLSLSSLQAKKIIYPESYNGTIVLPEKVEEVVVLGDIDCPEFETDRHSEDSIALRKMTFKGRIRVFSDPDGEMYYAKNLEELCLPEGLEEIRDWYLCNSNLRRLEVPETLISISNCDLEFYEGMDNYPTTEIIIYKTCPALKELQQQYNDIKNDIDDWNEMVQSLPNTKLSPHRTLPFVLTIKDAPRR